MSGSEFAVMSVYGGLSGPSDPNFANVSLLLHMDGANGGIVFTDSSANAFPVFQSQAITSNTQVKFGPTSGFFNGNHFISVAHAAPLELTTGDWTLEGWLYIGTLGSNSLVIMKAVGTGFYPWQLYYDATGHLIFRAFDTTPSLLFTITAATGLAAGGQHFWAMTRQGSTFTLWIDGVSAGTASSSAALYTNASASVVCGASGSSTIAMIGYLDDVRITKGVARYTAGFSVPTAAFPDH